MRRTALVAVALAALGAVPAAFAGGNAPPPPGTIKGVVRNVTCAGPCRVPPPPAPLYTGPGLTVTVKRLPSHDVVATLHPKDGRFAVEVGPGLYRVLARVEQPSPSTQPSCWQGSRRKVGLVDQGARVRLTVRNRCVV